MSMRASSATPAFTALLVNRQAPGASSPAAEALEYLSRHWLLALINGKQRAHRLTQSSGLRRKLQVGNPAYWYGHEDDPLDHLDDGDPAPDAHLRREQRWARQLVQDAQARLDEQTCAFDHALFDNVQALGKLLALREADQVVLCFVVLLSGFRFFADAVDECNLTVASVDELADLIAMITQCEREELRRALGTNAPLCLMGLVSFDRDGACLENFARLRRGLAPLLMARHNSADTLIEALVTPRTPSALGLEHFPHLAGELAVLLPFLRQALRQRVTGSNVLLYGPPGVGKTELASLVARELGVQLYEVPYSDDDGDPVRGKDRLSAYALTQRLLAERADALVLFDEVEDMLEEGETPGKAWVNRSLEDNRVPTIWITNHAQGMDPAYRRRFDYSLHITIPPRQVRRNIVRHYLQDMADAPVRPDDGAHGAWLDALADNPNLSPSQLEAAVKVARLVQAESPGGHDAAALREQVSHVLARSSRLLDQRPARTSRSAATSFDLAYLNTDVDVPRLVTALRRQPSGSFCFYGPPGAGKTALAHHLADALELPLVLRRASDLLDCYVGGTERNLAQMFEAAKAEPCVLVLDEADSFLQARSRAHRSWEVTQVNELLTQMEAHDGLFICTTNLLHTLDAASLRRFDWKVGFAPLTANQRWALFLQEFHLLGGDMSSAQGLQQAVRQQLAGITPGDFAPVTRQYRLLATTPAPQEFFRRLQAELDVKHGDSDRPWRATSANQPLLNHRHADALRA